MIDFLNGVSGSHLLDRISFSVQKSILDSLCHIPSIPTLLIGGYKCFFTPPPQELFFFLFSARNKGEKSLPCRHLLFHPFSGGTKRRGNLHPIPEIRLLVPLVVISLVVAAVSCPFNSPSTSVSTQDNSGWVELSMWR